MTKARIVYVGLFFFLAPSVYCCECETPSQSKAFRKASAVFVGKVIDIRDSNVSIVEGSNYSVAVTFEVSQYWKGTRNLQLTIHTEQGALSCNPFKFELGKEYLVYAREKQFIVWIGCSRSLPLSATPDATQELNALGKWKKPKST
jgi:hypothetical protein